MHENNGYNRHGHACGWEVNPKEEFMYYPIFRKKFPGVKELNRMGRTKDAPTAPVVGVMETGIPYIYPPCVESWLSLYKFG